MSSYQDDLEAQWFNTRHPEETAEDDQPPQVTSSQLAAADQAAQARPNVATSSSASCHASGLPIIVRIVGEDEQPIENVVFELRKSDTQTLLTRSGADGIGGFHGIEPGSYQLALPDLDQDAWEIGSSETIENPSKSDAVAWQAPPEREADSGSPHSIVEGECVSTLALRYGFHPNTIWNDDANAVLKKQRQEMNVLAEGDTVAIPAKRIAAHPVDAGTRVQLRRKGIPDVVRIRFLDAEGKPRADVPYLIELETTDGIEQRNGKTNADGYVIEKALAALGRVKITLGSEEEVYEFLPATLDPVETTAGVQARLVNLGYSCEDEDGEVGPLTTRALREFQRDYALPVSGEVDDATREELKKQHLS
ncbi:MAG: hypothetical protein QOI58_1646 [Thermoanaerobaculia bacterium]|jgi:peptidoglycan hydrolase-like protein with peptidoglycan-binding domain|nr:hypothetical protein [Thermoanaerobaculia bacterium]